MIQNLTLADISVFKRAHVGNRKLWRFAPKRQYLNYGEPWFAATDVCAALDIKNTSQATQPLDGDEKGISKTYTLGGEQELLTISISGLATLIVRSRLATTPGTKPHRFRRWIFGEVLPQIQKTGEYRPNAENGTHKVSTPGGDQPFACVNEPGLWRLILAAAAKRA